MDTGTDEGRHQELLRRLRRFRRQRRGKLVQSEIRALSRLITVLEQHSDAPRRASRWRKRWNVPAEERVPRGTGAVEKTQEVLIGRAMKRRGMSWSESGANDLVKLIMAYQDERVWSALWQELPPEM